MSMLFIIFIILYIK